MSPSRDLVPLVNPSSRRQRRWRSGLDAAWRLLRRIVRSPLARRLALTALLAALAVGAVGVSYATADPQAGPSRAVAQARRTATGTGATGTAAARAGERAPVGRPTMPAPPAGRAARQPGPAAGQPGPTADPRGHAPSRSGGTADPPAAGARQRPGSGVAGPGQRAAPGSPAAHPATRRAGSRAAGLAAATPQQAARAWYAARLGLATGQVRALGSQPTGPGRARVLVAAQTHPNRLATAWVGVGHTPTGWAVTP